MDVLLRTPIIMSNGCPIKNRQEAIMTTAAMGVLLRTISVYPRCDGCPIKNTISSDGCPIKNSNHHAAGNFHKKI